MFTGNIYSVNSSLSDRASPFVDGTSVHPFPQGLELRSLVLFLSNPTLQILLTSCFPARRTQAQHAAAVRARLREAGATWRQLRPFFAPGVQSVNGRTVAAQWPPSGRPVAASVAASVAAH